MVTSDFSSEVEIRPVRACAMHPATIIGTVRSLWTWLWTWGRYHVPQNAFLVSEKVDNLFSRRPQTYAKTATLTTPTLQPCLAQLKFPFKNLLLPPLGGALTTYPYNYARKNSRPGGAPAHTAMGVDHGGMRRTSTPRIWSRGR